MPHVQDCIFDRLSTYPGSVNEKLLAWLQANGATSDDYNTAWMQFLTLQGQAAGSLNDRLYAWLVSEGMMIGNIGDMWHQYWCDAFGPELITNGDFSDGATGWTMFGGNISVVGGKLVNTGVNSYATQVFIADTLVHGATYRLEYDYTHISGGISLGFHLGDGTIQWVDPDEGRNVLDLVAGTVNDTLYVCRSGGTVLHVETDNYSLRQAL